VVQAVRERKKNERRAFDIRIVLLRRSGKLLDSLLLGGLFG
jgi:hypothetical protein